jgi:hypothetical protein
MGESVTRIRTALALGVVVALAGCGTPAAVPQDLALAQDQQLGQPQATTTARLRTAREAIAERRLSGSGAVPLAFFKSDALFVENVYAIQTGMEACTKAMTDLLKRVLKQDSKAFAAYYCVPLQDGKPGAPMLVAQYNA